MSLKIIAQLSHFTTMMFGMALGISLCILYQYRIGIFIEDIAPFVIFLVLLSGGLRVYTLFLFRKYSLDTKIFKKYQNL
tara:strand:+ start:761 stop:997 length:237 start_codon:yes stop_codon:yes gene_type:complete